MRSLRLLAVLGIIACGGDGGSGITPPARKPDPFITVRVRDLLDTTTAAGRAHWHTFLDITSADPNQTGFVAIGNTSLQDIRLQHVLHCAGISADSIGQRFVAFVALADTTTEELTPDAPAVALGRDWFAGNHTLPAGWAALYQPPTDPWTSAQFNAGHGLTATDPIRWGWDWSDGGGVLTFYERVAGDDNACNAF